MPQKIKKRKVNASKAILKSQVSNIYAPIIRIRSKELSPLDKYLMNRAFITFDEDSSFWELTSNCKVFNSGMGYHIRFLWRGRKTDKTGQRRTSQRYATIIEAENNAYEYRYSLESKCSKEKLN